MPSLSDVPAAGRKCCRGPGCKQPDGGGTFKPTTEFSYFARAKDRLQSYCKPCSRAKARQRYRAKTHAYTDALVAWNDRDPRKRKAHRAVQKSLRNGTLTKKPCEHPGCGCVKVEADHYKGYAEEFWLVVRWLCREHHAFHRRNVPVKEGRKVADRQQRRTSVRARVGHVSSGHGPDRDPNPQPRLHLS